MRYQINEKPFILSAHGISAEIRDDLSDDHGDDISDAITRVTSGGDGGDAGGRDPIPTCKSLRVSP